METLGMKISRVHLWNNKVIYKYWGSVVNKVDVMVPSNLFMDYQFGVEIIPGAYYKIMMLIREEIK